MGMAASQARYLGLQARKTNTEYEGQQVNQQRTALSNQSSEIFRKMLTMSVPTPPVQEDYKTNNYKYNDPTSLDGKTTVESIIEDAGSNPPTYTVQVKKKINEIQYSSFKNQAVSTTKGSDNKKSINLPNGTQYELEGPIDGMSQSLCDEFNKLGNASYQNEKTDKYYKFVNPTSKSTYYINATKTGFDPEVETNQNVDFFTTMTTEKEVYETIENVTASKSDTGEFTSLYWMDESGKHNYNLTPSSEYDEAGYDAAMNNYSYQKTLYDKEVEDMNTKTQQLQETDRTLELRLKQLDTEQEALQTELDSVKKVIDKNIENVFKTFQ